MRIQFFLLIIVTLIVSKNIFASDIQKTSNKCLYGKVTVGAEGKTVITCPDSDPLNIRKDLNVLLIMNALGIKQNQVRFKGCSNLPYSAGMDTPLNEINRRYLITYPIQDKNKYISPITHELAHVSQMEVYGGLIQLSNKINSSKRIELGADYISGIVFSKILRHLDYYDFMDNFSLMGLYVELKEKAHGTPAQRVSAFRSGFYEKNEHAINQAHDYFQQEIYGSIIINESN